MATIVGEALLAASLEVLLRKIVSGEFFDLFRSTKLDVALLEKLNITLVSLQAVLHDAEEKQITNPAVKQWLDMLQDAVFEAADLFDEINSEALRCKVEAEYETQTATTKVLNKLSFRFKRFNKKINSKLQMLFERLEHLRKQKLGLKEGGSSSVWHITPTTSVVGDESSVYSRHDDKKILKELLLAEDSSDGESKIGVILDIRGTRLKEMPIQLSRLENLQTLSDFVVSIHDVALKITDLGKYPHLRGNLSISQLENVIESSHAFQANLEMKKQIDELELAWFNVTPSNSIIQSVVLEQLRPLTNLKSLTIRGYGGNNFPNWLGDSLFCHMVRLKISCCEKCSVLPPLGYLGNLKKLFIGEMKSVKSVGTEFNGMLEWEEWKLTAGTTGEFPRLTCLSLWNCPKLIGNIPLGQLGNLKKLSFLALNSIKTLGTEFYGSTNSPLFQPFLSLETLEFWYMQEWEEWKLIGGTSTEFPSLTRLSLHDCPKLKGNIPGSLPNLTSLTVDNCPKLEGNMPDKLPSLTQLELCGLPTSDHIFRQLMIPFNSLHCLTIKNLSSLTSFPRDGLPKTLKSLSIWNCENLEFIPCESFHNYKLLEKLNIVNSGMTSFTLGSFPVLNSLYITDCKNLKSILIAKDVSQHNLLFLSSIYIVDCNELDSVSLGGLSFPNLIDLNVNGCKKLRSLPESIKTLSNLQKIEIYDLPNLQSFSMDDFPASLRELIVGNVGGILWNTSWECYTSLSKLHIKGDDIVMALMKMEVPLLPTSLVTLTMDHLEDIKCLDGKWLQHLTSLEYLEIDTAPKLKSLAKDGKLPCSLKSLYINDCPLLKEIFQRKRGKEWRKIAHIPFIEIDNEMIT